MAATQPEHQPYKTVMRDLIANAIDTGAVIWDGTLAVNVAGNARPFTDTLFQAGNPLLGGATDTFDNRLGVAPKQERQLYFRDCEWLVPNAKVGDVPTAAQVGNVISIADDNTVKATKGGTDLGVVLLEILPNNAGYRVQIP